MPTTGRLMPASVDHGPNLAFCRVKDADADDQKQEHSNPYAVSRIEAGLGSPGQESGNVVRHLRHGRLGAIGKGYSAVAEWRRHRYLVAGENLVIVLALRELEAGRRFVLETGEDPEDVI